MGNKQNSFLTKKPFLIFVGIIVIGIPAVFAMLNYVKPQDTQSDQPDNVSLTPSQATQNLSDAPSTTPREIIQWNDYKANTFSFQYPPDWNAQTYPIGPSGADGLAVIVKPNALPQGIYYPQFNLQTQKDTVSSWQNKTGFLEGFHMQKSMIMIGNDEATQYKGTIPFKTVDQSTVMQPIQDTTVLLKKNGTLYTLKYEYDGSDENQSLDDYFNDFIQSFKGK